LCAQVSKGSMSMLRSNAAAGHIPSRLGRSQPGSPTSAYTVTGIGFGAADTSQLRDCAPHSTMRSLVGAQGSAGAPRTQLRQQQQQSRVSLGSNTSSTPAGLMISPGVAALASKYATSSVGGSSVGGLSLQEQPSAGEGSRPLRHRHARPQYALGAALRTGLQQLLTTLRWHMQLQSSDLLTLGWRCLHGRVPAAGRTAATHITHGCTFPVLCCRCH
jgi:hypothetical protein